MRLLDVKSFVKVLLSREDTERSDVPNGLAFDLMGVAHQEDLSHRIYLSL